MKGALFSTQTARRTNTFVTFGRVQQSDLGIVTTLLSNRPAFQFAQAGQSIVNNEFFLPLRRIDPFEVNEREFGRGDIVRKCSLGRNGEPFLGHENQDLSRDGREKRDQKAPFGHVRRAGIADNISSELTVA